MEDKTSIGQIRARTRPEERLSLEVWPERNSLLGLLQRITGAVRHFARVSPVGAMGGVILLILLLAAVFAPWLAPYDPLEVVLSQKLLPPSPAHPFGTDQLGRDILSRTLFGARISMTIGLVVVLFAYAPGICLGLLAGYLGGPVDQIIMRLADMFMAFPALILAMAFAAALGPSLINVMIALSLVSWTGSARLIRGVVLSVREEDYIMAAKAIGVPQSRILIRHILPNSYATLLVAATLRMGASILAASGLSFIGFGIQPPSPEWGAMVSEGRIYLVTQPWLTTVPGLAIFLTVTGYNLFGDGLRDVLDPRLRGEI